MTSVFETVETQGGLSVSDFMKACVQTYYATQNPFGAQGDFMTAPEASPFFGDMLGLWVLDIWGQMGHCPVHLVELGPGRGTLMHDMLRTLLKHEKSQNISVHLVEQSAQLKQEQQQKLSDVSLDKLWHDTIETLPNDKPVIIMANEFFDALPVQQFVMVDGQMVERFVRARSGALVFDPADGNILETAVEAQRIMRALSMLIQQAGGVLLVIDYGYAKGQTGSTLQAVRKHKKVNVLDFAGEADLTALVHFQALKRAAESVGAVTQPITTQRAFLKLLGIDIWVQKILAKAPDASSYYAGLERILAPDQMGDLFKVLCVHHKTLSPAGFAGV